MLTGQGGAGGRELGAGPCVGYVVEKEQFPHWLPGYLPFRVAGAVPS